MPQFSNKWTKSSSPTLKEKVKESIRPAGPLKPRLEAAIKQIQVQISKLGSTASKLEIRDNSIFNKVVLSVQKHDMSHATVYANELAEIRKMNRMVTQAKIALEQIVLRLNTVQELGDVVVTLSPAMSVIRNVKTGLGSILPEADREIGEISNLLSSILVDAGQITESTVDFEAANEDAEKILSEASVVAEQRMGDKFPDLPLDENIPSTEGVE